MDAQEFLSRVTPGRQQSRLTPFLADITMLRQRGCTLEQVCEFLAANKVQISIAGLSKFIKRRENSPDASRGSSASTPTRSPALTATAVPTPHEEAAAEPSRIANPADVRKASRREINLEDYGNEKE